ncbi:MAG: hypothetical protein ACJ8D5_06595 [Sphingomicrobium sp.]
MKTTTKTSKPTKSKPRMPRGRRGHTPDTQEVHQATAKEFEREGLGIAPKE